MKSKLIADREVKALDVNVDTYEGVVTLRGEVGSAAQRAAAERIARESKGVKAVKNELRVEVRLSSRWMSSKESSPSSHRAPWCCS